MSELVAAWDVVDEGPMDDLLGIEVQRNKDGTITLHQHSYISKLVRRFLARSGSDAQVGGRKSPGAVGRRPARGHGASERERVTRMRSRAHDETHPVLCHV